MESINNKTYKKLGKLCQDINSEVVGEDYKMKDNICYYIFDFERSLDDVFRTIDISTWEKVCHEEIKSITPLKKQ
jgi:hypothetical protein